MSEVARTGWHPSGMCSLFACDVAAFGDPTRSDDVREYVRDALYEALESSFAAAGLALADCYCEDRGDGAVVAVPPARGTAPLITTVAEGLDAHLRRHNTRSSDAARIHLRVAVHAGEIETDRHGLVGTAVNHVFRLLEAGPLKDALSDSGARVAMVVSLRVHEDVVRHGRGLVDPGDYRQVEVAVKETTTPAWIRLLGAHGTVAPVRSAPPTGGLPLAGGLPAARSGSPARSGPPALSHPGMIGLVDRALAIPLVLDAGGRRQVVGALPIEIAGVIPRSADARTDTYNIIRTCLDYPGGLHDLLEVLRGFVGESMALRAFEQAIVDLL